MAEKTGLRKYMLRPATLILIMAVAISCSTAYDASDDRIPAAEFSRIVRNFSEEGGYFLSDNLVSNEDGYLSVLEKLRELHISGGAYIGVGPEQNFTYIAKVRPAIAFLVDLRRQAMIQHLMYKAVFHLSRNRAEFLARLLSRPLNGKGAPGPDSTLPALMGYFGSAPADASYHAANLTEIEQAIQSDFEFPLSKDDRESLSYIYGRFYREGLRLSFQFNGYRGRRFFGMPALGELIEQVDSEGNPGNFLASNADYQFVRELHEKNRIIPVVGDFAGQKTFRAIAGYLRSHSCPVKVFYTSNVEMYLFQDGTFDDFVKNVKALPVTKDSIFIRSANSRRRRRFRGYLMSTMLQYISVFLKDRQDGLYMDYWTFVETHTIPLN